VNGKQEASAAGTTTNNEENVNLLLGARDEKGDLLSIVESSDARFYAAALFSPPNLSVEYIDQSSLRHLLNRRDSVGLLGGGTTVVTSSVADEISYTDTATTIISALSGSSDTVTISETATNSLQLTSSVTGDTVTVSDSILQDVVVSLLRSDQYSISDPSIGDSVEVDTAISEDLTVEDQIKQAIKVYVSRSETFTYVESINSTTGTIEVELPDGRTLVVNRQARIYTVRTGSRVYRPEG
jgi:hypothetical protein